MSTFAMYCQHQGRIQGKGGGGGGGAAGPSPPIFLFILLKSFLKDFFSLLLLYVHRYIDLDYDKIINMYATRHTMMLINPLAEDCGSDH